MRIRERCSCGAKFEVNGGGFGETVTFTHLKTAAQEWRENHQHIVVESMNAELLEGDPCVPIIHRHEALKAISQFFSGVLFQAEPGRAPLSYTHGQLLDVVLGALGFPLGYEDPVDQADPNAGRFERQG